MTDNVETPTVDQLAARLDALERRDRRQVRIIAVLVVVAVVPWPVVGWLARSLDTRNDAVSALTVLVERQECTDLAEARWEDAISRLIVAAAAGDDEAVVDAGAELGGMESLTEQIDACPE